MHKIELNGHTLELYQTAAELPIKRYSQFQKYNVMESGIGSDMDAIGGHFSKLFEFITYDMKADAMQEAKNLYYNFYTMLQNISIPGMAFGCLLHTVDGEKVVDVSEEGLKRIVDKLDAIGLTHAVCTGWVETAKKKSIAN